MPVRRTFHIGLRTRRYGRPGGTVDEPWVTGPTLVSLASVLHTDAALGFPRPFEGFSKGLQSLHPSFTLGRKFLDRLSRGPSDPSGPFHGGGGAPTQCSSRAARPGPPRPDNPSRRSTGVGSDAGPPQKEEVENPQPSEVAPPPLP